MSKCYNSELPIGPPGPQGPPGESATSAYKVYTALLTQTGTDAPTANVLFDNLEATISFTYSVAGEYLCEADSAIFTENKTFISIANTASGTTAERFLIQVLSDSLDNLSFLLTSYDVNGGVLVNNVLLNTPIEIRVYP